jgi:Ca-activated chloride channel homolog
MNRKITSSLLAVLVVLGIAKSLNAQAADPPRRPPVLRSGGTYSDKSNESRDNQSSSTNTTDSAQAGATLVTIPAVVMDRNGRYIANLHKEDFQIFQDGVEQKVASFASVEKPFTVALMLDVSGSTQYQLAQIRDAANTFLGRLRLEDRLMALTFDGEIHVLTEPATAAMIRRTKLHIPAVTDGTVLYDAVAFALKRMAQIPGRKAIVLMTDGVDQSSKLASLQGTLDEIAEQDVLIYTVQYNTLPQLPQRLSVIKNEKARRKVQERLMKGYALSEPYLRSLAENTGGRFYKADDLRDVAPAFEAITAELGVQYSLSFYPQQKSGIGEHSIRVKVRFPNMVVRARDSYTTSPTIAKQ